jgi:predicted N-formylglutamate amidohydrolase
LTRPRFDALLITCEHASNAVPKRWRPAFRGKPEVLNTHRAWDPGAATLARELAKHFSAPLHEGVMTRLLVDLNRRAKSPNLHSSFTPPEARAELAAYHGSWRAAVLADARKLLKRGQLLHVSCHSFTPALKGETRNAEIGLLYNPAHRSEKNTADHWHAMLTSAMPELRIRRNYPYRGISDGITTWLHRQLKGNRYTGFEIELNHSFSAKPPAHWRNIRDAIRDVISGSLA